jgi:hypothetical protein
MMELFANNYYTLWGSKFKCFTKSSFALIVSSARVLTENKKDYSVKSSLNSCLVEETGISLNFLIEDIDRF